MFLKMCALLLLVAVGTAEAGNNAGGMAWLSWDEEGYRPAEPAQPFLGGKPLYLHFSGVPDLQGVQFELRWTSPDSGRAFTFVSTNPDNFWGWTTTAAYDSSSTSSWGFQSTTEFAPESPRTGIALAVAADTSEAIGGGTFWIASAVTIDANGQIDTLETLESAYLVPAPPTLLQVSPGSPVPGAIYVKLAARPDEVVGNGLSLSQIGNSSLRHRLKGAGFRGGRRMFEGFAPEDTLHTDATGAVIALADLSLWYEFLIDPLLDPTVVVDSLRREPFVESTTPITAMKVDAVPNDPLLTSQWQLVSPVGIGAPQAWDIQKGRNDVVVGIIDSGVDYNHLDLDPGDRTHVLPGRDVAEEDDDPSDTTPISQTLLHGHGTAVAGVVGARTDNGLQLAGTMWRGSVLPVKVAVDEPPSLCFCNTYMFDGDIAKGIWWAAAHGAHIINMSLGGERPAIATEWLGDPIAEATLNAHRIGCVLVAASGNDSKNGEHVTPAAYPWVVAVGAVDGDTARVNFSNFGNHLDLVAPGVELRALKPNQQVTFVAGTSFAAPIVSGVAGLVLSQARDLALPVTNEDAVSIVERSAIDIKRTGPGRDDQTGYGLVSASRAVGMLAPPNGFFQGRELAPSVTMTMGSHTHTFIADGGGVISGEYYGVEQYKVSKHVAFCSPFQSTPEVWARGLQSRGYDAANPTIAFTTAQVTNVSTAGFDINAYVYWVPYDVGGGYVGKWWPCRPEDAILAWSAVGVAPLAAPEIVGTHMSCTASLTGQACGGSVEADYAWYERPPGGTWSSVIGTGLKLVRNLPFHDMEYRLDITNASVSVSDTHYVAYSPCVVGAEQAQIVFGLRAVPNPSRGRMSLLLALPIKSEVAVIMYDVAGRRVRGLVNEVRDEGIHSIEFDGRGDRGEQLGAGVYFVKARTASGTKVSRIVMLE